MLILAAVDCGLGTIDLIVAVLVKEGVLLLVHALVELVRLALANLDLSAGEVHRVDAPVHLLLVIHAVVDHCLWQILLSHCLVNIIIRRRLVLGHTARRLHIDVGDRRQVQLADVTHGVVAD